MYTYTYTFLEFRIDMIVLIPFQLFLLLTPSWSSYSHTAQLWVCMLALRSYHKTICSTRSRSRQNYHCNSEKLRATHVVMQATHAFSEVVFAEQEQSKHITHLTCRANLRQQDIICVFVRCLNVSTSQKYFSQHICTFVHRVKVH